MNHDPRRELTIRQATGGDAESLANIYNYYVAETTVTFEEEPVTAAKMAARVQEVRGAALPWLAAESEGEVVGYAFAGKWKGRSAYRFTVEVSVFLGQKWTGHGIGSRLYRQLLDELRAAGLHAAIGGIALPNDASIALHEHFGFEKVAHFRAVGYKFRNWIDVGYWQKVL